MFTFKGGKGMKRKTLSQSRGGEIRSGTECEKKCGREKVEDILKIKVV